MQVHDCSAAWSAPYAGAMELYRAFEFASDAVRLSVLGAAFLVLAGIASLMERRRLKRAEINQVGWMPWTGLFLTCAVIGGGLLAISLPKVLSGS